MKYIVVLLSFCLVASRNQAQPNCNVFNLNFGPYQHTNSDNSQHSDGQHSWANFTYGYCTYSGTSAVGESVPCGVHSEAHSSSAVYESGSTGIYYHVGNIKDTVGLADGPIGGSAVTDAEGAVSVVSCALIPCGLPSINITGGGFGGGFQVNYNPPPFWTDGPIYCANTSCTSRSLAPATCTPSGPPPYPATPPDYWSWNTSTCQYQLIWGGSPIVIDTKGTGFKFSDPDKGNYVTFDLGGNGKYEKLSWPEAGSNNMWLALPDTNGTVSNGKQLFGNFTPHSDGGVAGHPNPNGFLALAWYDQPSQGGDGNLILDQKDAIWFKLRLWDASRCLQNPNEPCVSQPGELHSLESEGIYSISLLWDGLSKMPAGTPAALQKDGSPVYGPLGAPTDVVGNQYRFYSLLNPDAENLPANDKGETCCDLHRQSHDGRWAIDVYLKYVP